MAISLLRSLNVATTQVVAALFIQTCYVLGTVKSIGVFDIEFRETLGVTSSDLGITLGLFNAFTFGPGPIVAHLYSRDGFKRPLLITGAILAPVGLIISSIVTNNVQLALCLSLGGIGANILSQCLVICLNAHAPDHFNTFFGISKSGYAFGMLISPILAAYLMDVFGWRGAMLIMGATMCHLVPLTLMVDTNIVHRPDKFVISESIASPIPSDKGYIEDRDSGKTSAEKYASPSKGNINLLEESQSEVDGESSSLIETNQGTKTQSHNQHQAINELSPPESNTPPAAADTSSKLFFNRIRQTFTDSVYNQDKCLIVFLIANFFVAMLHGGWHSFFISHAFSRGVSLKSTLYLLYSTSMACFIARVFSGVLLNPRFISGYDFFIFLRLVNVASMLVDINTSNFTVMVVMSFFTSFAINEENLFMIFIARERSPPKAFSRVFAFIQIAFGLGALVGTYLTGMLADITGSYKASFIFLASVEAAILIIMIPPRFLK